MLRALGRPVTPDASQVVQKYRAVRRCKLTAYASSVSLKRMMMCARYVLHDKTVLGKQQTHTFLQEGARPVLFFHKLKYARQCALYEKEYKRQTEYTKGVRKAPTHARG